MLKLIIADDEPAIRNSISTLIDWDALSLELVGVCGSGPETLRAILNKRPDIVLTDIKMPGMSGLELIARVCEADLDTEFIILSGYADFDYAKQAIQYQVSNYLLKPCNENQIIEAVQKAAALIRRRKKIRELIPGQLLSPETTHPGYKDCVQKILDYVDLHFADSSLSLKKIAAEVLYMNEDYLSKEFSKATGQKFTEYITTLRMTKAKALLSSDAFQTVTHVAEQVGFSHNPQYFVQLFKNTAGMTPRAYARQYRRTSNPAGPDAPSRSAGHAADRQTARTDFSLRTPES